MYPKNVKTHLDQPVFYYRSLSQAMPRRQHFLKYLVYGLLATFFVSLVIIGEFYFLVYINNCYVIIKDVS